MKTIIKTTSITPSKLLNINNFKGSLEVGKDADFVIWNPFKVVKI